MKNKNQLLKCTRKGMQFWLFLLLSCFSSFAQAQLRVTGVVTDETGESIIGANIFEKGASNNGTISDIDGNFTLEVNSDKAVLVISFIGYKEKSVPVNGRKNIKVVLSEDSQALDEVVVVGYGSVKKSNLTTSVSKMTSEVIEGRPVTSLSDALSGQLAGVMTNTGSGIPGEEMQITVRGVSSINGSSSPLIVVDGVITETMSDVNPSDVASIQVLKDAAATSIYGARGSAGVILIETKQAQKGAPTVKWESYVGFQNAVGLPEMMSPKEWLAYNLWIKNAMWLQKDGNNTLDTPNKNRPSGDQVNPNWLQNPDSDVADWTLRSDLPQTDWVDAILQTAFTHSHQVSVSSKGDRYSIYASAGYLNQEGIVKYTGYERFNFRINASVDINKYISAGVNFAPTISSQDRGESEGKDKVIMTALQTIPIIGMDEGTRSLGFSKFRKDDVNPYERLRQVTDSREQKNFNVSSWVEAKIYKNLVFKTLFSYNSDNRIDEYFLPLDVQKMSVKSATASSAVVSGSRTGWQNTLNYDFTLWKKHEMNILLGQSIDSRSIYTADMGATDFPLDNVYTLNQGATPTKASTVRNVVRTSSLFARLSYNYADRYLFSASVRRDGSSRFGPSNRWATFPSVSAGWKINSEKFMKNVKFISLMKLRASWGMSGNDRIGYNDYVSTFSTDNTAYGNTSTIAIYPTNYANPDLKWETTKALDFGFDLSLFRNRVQLNVDYYINRTDDLLYNLQLPAAAGFNTMRTNLASIENRGWEIDLTTTNINTKGFKWSTTLNLSNNQNEVLDLGGNDKIISEAWNAAFITEVGGPISQFYTYRTNGLLSEDDFEKGADGRYNPKKPLVPTVKGKTQRPGNVKYVDVDGNGTIDADDRVAYGSNDPDVMFGFTNRFSYKNLELSIFLRGQIGGNVLWLGSRNLDTGGKYGANNTLKRWLHCYKEDYPNGNPIPEELGIDMSWDGKTPTPYGLGDNSEQDGQLHRTDLEIYDATFLRIQNISLTYNLPKKWINVLGVKGAKIYGTVENLYTFTDYIGNPDTNSYSTNPMLRGADYNTYPLSRKYIFGVNVTF
ncbi:TonB-dependent receptor [Mediterranea massiliensis]|uniref:SusC/RagA family TonB-linked outer membrane protein n=1 Tax=Mediterranea massiliensis TaxID=1841865 RepID=UPI00320A6C09